MALEPGDYTLRVDDDEPVYPYVGMIWLDVTNRLFKRNVGTPTQVVWQTVGGGSGEGGGPADASELSSSPTGGISATNVQAAIAELEAEKAASGHTHAGFSPTGHTHDYAATDHDHTEAEITDLGAYPDATGQPSGKVAQTDGADGWEFIDTPAGGGGGGGEVFSITVAANDAPTAVKDAADYVCDGTADQVQINAAIVAAAGSGVATGDSDAPTNMYGRVLLSAGQFKIESPILMKTGVHLQGAGPLTRLQAVGLDVSTDDAGSGVGAAVIKLLDNTVHVTHVSDLWINGNYGSGGSCHGIHYANGGDTSYYPDFSPDPDHMLTNLWISRFTGGTRHGIWLSNDCRGTIANNIQIRDVSGNAMRLTGSPDSHFSNIHANADDTGWYISSSNVKLTNCKAYFCGNAGAWGFDLQAQRILLAGCESQDNRNGVRFGVERCQATNLMLDTHLETALEIANWRNVVEGFNIYQRGGTAPYTTLTNGVLFTSNPNECIITGIVRSTDITNPTSGTYATTRNFIRITTGAALVSQG